MRETIFGQPLLALSVPHCRGTGRSMKNRVAVKNMVAAFATFCTLQATEAQAHPHVFADARLEVVIEDGAVASLRHVWRFDFEFTATILLEFDKDGDGQMSPEETAHVAGIIKSSTADYNYFHTVTVGDRAIDVLVPGEIMLDFTDGQMIMLFESVPAEKVALEQAPTFGIFDPTFYTSIEFIRDSDMVVMGLPDACDRSVVRPDPDEVLAENQGSLTEEFFAEGEDNDISRMFATRLELSCNV